MLAGGIPRSEGVRPGREGQVAMEGLLVTGVWVAGLWGTVGRWAGHGAWSECGCCQGRGGRCGWRCGRGLAVGVVWLWAWSGDVVRSGAQSACGRAQGSTARLCPMMAERPGALGPEWGRALGLGAVPPPRVSCCSAGRHHTLGHARWGD